MPGLRRLDRLLRLVLRVQTMIIEVRDSMTDVVLVRYVGRYGEMRGVENSVVVALREVME